MSPKSQLACSTATGMPPRPRSMNQGRCSFAGSSRRAIARAASAMGLRRSSAVCATPASGARPDAPPGSLESAFLSAPGQTAVNRVSSEAPTMLESERHEQSSGEGIVVQIRPEPPVAERFIVPLYFTQRRKAAKKNAKEPLFANVHKSADNSPPVLAPLRLCVKLCASQSPTAWSCRPAAWARSPRRSARPAPRG